MSGGDWWEMFFAVIQAPQTAMGAFSMSLVGLSLSVNIFTRGANACRDQCSTVMTPSVTSHDSRALLLMAYGCAVVLPQTWS